MKKTFASLILASLAACSQPASDKPVDAPSSPAAENASVISPSGEVAGGADIVYDGSIPKPIMVGSDGPDTDACGTVAKVATLVGQEVGYLSVRDAPSGMTKERDRLEPGQGVSVCVSDGAWSGVIYAKPDDEAHDCGVGSPVNPAQPYRGPCQQGWVVTQYLEMVAG
ncbi:hypothetical protein [Erythrobacter sp. R86502]|uniref:hypothetical protein n=1 Tax=Erythrobacter sp. R86502 TaxID=3093846 RepID=UPI0036D3CB84